MKPFKFRLETLLKLKRNVRDQRSAEYQEVLHAQAEIQKQKNEVELEIQLTQQYALNRVKPGIVNVDQLTSDHQQLLDLKMMSQQKDLLAQQLEPHLKQREQALVQADQEVKVLEKLKERQWQQHQLQLEKQEAKELDQQAQLLYTRQQNKER